MRGDERRLTWDEQRASERARYADITARKVEYRRELRDGARAADRDVAGGVPRCARARRLARRDRERTRGAQTRTPSRAAPSVARVCNRSRPCRRRRGNLGAARSAVSRAARRARARLETPDFALRGAGDAEPRFMRDLRDVATRASSVTATSATDGATAARRFAIGGLRLRFATRAMQRRRGARARARQVGQQGHDSRQRRLQRACPAPRRRTRDTHQQSGTASSPARLVVELERTRSQDRELLRERSRDRARWPGCRPEPMSEATFYRYSRVLAVRQRSVVLSSAASQESERLGRAGPSRPSQMEEAAAACRYRSFLFALVRVLGRGWRDGGYRLRCRRHPCRDRDFRASLALLEMRPLWGLGFSHGLPHSAVDRSVLVRQRRSSIRGPRSREHHSA